MRRCDGRRRHHEKQCEFSGASRSSSEYCQIHAHIVTRTFWRPWERVPCHVDKNVSLLCSISYAATFIYNSQPLHSLFISLRNHIPMRCDLHVHSVASGMCSTPVLNRICRESYNDATEVYKRLKKLGMAIVTITDPDSIA